jgi:hypothetical protein
MLDVTGRGAVRGDDQAQRLTEATWGCDPAAWAPAVAWSPRSTAGSQNSRLDVLVELLDEVLVEQHHRQRGGRQRDGKEQSDDRGDELGGE